MFIFLCTFWSPCALFCGFWFFGRFRRSNVWWRSLFDTHFKTQEPYFLRLGVLEGLGGQMCLGVHLLMHIVNPKCCILWDWGLSKVYDIKCLLVFTFECTLKAHVLYFVGSCFLKGLWGRMCVGVHLLMHICMPSGIFWGVLVFWKVCKVKCLPMLALWCAFAFWIPCAIFFEFWIFGR